MIFKSLHPPEQIPGIRNGLGSPKADFRAVHTIFKEHLKKIPGKVSPESLSEWANNIGRNQKEVKFLAEGEKIFFQESAARKPP
jgi:hypothetical protein